MYVYSNIVELYPVGNSQVPIMGFFPIKTNFKKRMIKYSIRFCMPGPGQPILILSQ